MSDKHEKDTNKGDDLHALDTNPKEFWIDLSYSNEEVLISTHKTNMDKKYWESFHTIEYSAYEASEKALRKAAEIILEESLNRNGAWKSVEDVLSYLRGNK
jgi:hypothetical protein